MVCQAEKEECLTIRIHTVMFHALTGKRDAKFKVLRVLKKFTGSCHHHHHHHHHHHLLLPLKYCSSRTKIFILFQDLVLKNAIITYESTEINYTADQNNIIVTNVSNSN
jgi:hypothetical protein